MVAIIITTLICSTIAFLVSFGIRMAVKAEERVALAVEDGKLARDYYRMRHEDQANTILKLEMELAQLKKKRNW